MDDGCGEIGYGDAADTWREWCRQIRQRRLPTGHGGAALEAPEAAVDVRAVPTAMQMRIGAWAKGVLYVTREFERGVRLRPSQIKVGDAPAGSPCVFKVA